MLYFTVLLLGSMILTRPWKMYYDYKDPLLKDKNDTLEGVSAEQTLIRLKYKQKVNGWLTSAAK